MGKLKLFFACLLMAVLSIGQVWADSPATITFGDLSLTNQQQYTDPFDIDANVSITFAGGANDGKYYDTGAGIRTYGGGTITINAGSYTITEAAFTWDGSNKPGADNAAPTGYSTSTGKWTGSASSIVLTRPSGSGHWRLKSVTVTYSTGGATIPVSSVSLDESAIELAVGENQTLTATVLPNDATNKSVTWESDDTDVATVEGGLVTAIGEGTATITCKSAADNTKTATCAVTVTAAETPTLTFDFSAQGYTNQQQYTSINADAKITISFGDGSNDGKYYDTGAAMRVYGGGHMTVAGGEGVTISKILLEFGSGDGSNAISTADNAYDNGKWTGSAQSVTFNVGGSSGHRRIKVVKVFYVAATIDVAMPTISGVTPFLSSTEVTLTQNDADAIYFTTDEAKKENPSVDTWTEYNSASKPSFNATTTIYAAAIKGSAWSAVAEQTFTKATVLTVAEAIALIPNKDDVVNNQYVAGIVCTAAPSLLSGGKLTYYISADGSETNRLQIYKGKNLNNTEFTAVSDLAIGDRVTVFGQLKNFNNTPEMNDGNYLVSKEGSAVAAPVFSPDGGGFMGETDVTITCATAGSAIYYTTDGETPSKLSTPYTAAIHLDATTTIKAIAYVNDDPSIVISKTFTLTAPMTVAEALAALDSEDPINNVAVAGIISTAPTSNPSSGKLTYYISDDGSDTNELEVYLGFGLNGASFSAKTDLQAGDEVTVFGNLKIHSGSSGDVKEFDAGSRLLAFNRPEVPVTAVEMAEVTAEVEVGSTVTLHAHVMPENATDQSLTWTVESGSDKASVDENGVVTGVAEGTAVIRAASPDYPYYAECTVTVTAVDPTKHVVTFDATVDKTTENTELSITKSNVTIAITTGDGRFNNSTDYRIYKNAVFTVSCSAGNITKLEFTCNSGNPITGFAEISSDVWTGNAESVSFTASNKQVQITQLIVTYKEDNRAEAGIAFTPENAAITKGESWSEPIFINPHDLDVTFSSNNESVAKVSDAGAVSLQDGTGTAVITATFDGDDTYKPATVTYTITVNAPLSPWAYVYTSNLTLAVDDNDTKAYAEKVKITVEEVLTEFPALRAATGSAAGTCHVIVPAGTQTLHFHAAAWNNKTSTITVKMGETTLLEQPITADAGINSNSPYTLEGNAYEYYYSIDLSSYNLTEETRITFSAASGKQSVFFGINQEGGVVPVLQSLAISGDLDTKTYEAGQAIDPTGLTVTGTYDVGDPVDVTSQVEEWLYDALETGDESVTISARIGNIVSPGVEITGLTVTEATPTIDASPKFWNFNSVSKDASVAAKEITVTLTNVAAATVTLSGTGAAAFTVDQDALTASGTINITPITTTVGDYQAKVTISDDAHVATSVDITVMMKVLPVDDGDALLSGVWTLVTDASQLIDGSKVIIAQYVDADGAIRTMSTQNTNNRASVESTVTGTSLTPAEGTRVMTVEALEGGKFAFRTNINTYLYAASSSSNNLKEQLELNDNGKWAITIDGENKAVITAQGTNSHNLMRYNEGSELFSCYASGQKDVQLFIRTADFTRTDMFSPGVIGTVCVDHNVPFAGIEGATFYELAGLVSTGFIAFDEIVSGQLEAGVPYLFQANANELKLYYGTITVPSPVTPGNGMYGTFEPIDVTENLDDVYYFAQHNFWSCSGMSSLHMPANRAYVRMSEVPSAAPNPNPGRRRVVMGVNGTNTTTGCENIESGNAPRKQLIDGAIYIIRGEKVYDTTGRLVK